MGFNHALANTFAPVYPAAFFIHHRNTYQSYTWTDSCFKKIYMIMWIGAHLGYTFPGQNTT